jgi:probable HAF family extracellular repeat protein
MNHKSSWMLNGFLATILSLVSPLSLTGAQGNSATPGRLQTVDPPIPPMGIAPEALTRLAGTVYSVQDLGTLGGGSTYARAVNLSGTVTGWSNLGPGGVYERAYTWQNGWLEALPVLGGNPVLSMGYSLNTSGQVVGYSSSPDGTSRAVLWSGTGITDLGTLGGRNAAALHVNDLGQKVGWSEFSPESGERRAVIWSSSGGISALAAGGNYNAAWSINDAGKAVGECVTLSSPLVMQPCAWPGGVLAVLGGSQGSARDINEAGTIAGWAETAQLDHHGGYIPHAALWDAGGVHDLGSLPGNKVSRANAINAQGQVVGAASTAGDLASSPTHAVLWEDGQITDLNDRLPVGADWVLTEAYGINDAGQIVGAGGHAGVYYRAFMLTPATQPVVTLEGPGLGLVGQEYTYTATAGPVTLEQPITYTWTATNQPTTIVSGGLTNTRTLSWAHTGPQEITVTIASALGAGSTALHPIDIGDVLVQPTPGSSEEIAYTFAPDRTVTLTIPPDTVPGGTDLLFTALPRPSAPSMYSFTGIAFTLDAYVSGHRQPGFVFGQPVTVTMTFAADDVAGLDESAILLYYQVGSSWIDAASTCQPASQYVRDLQHHRLSVSVCHLSTFATWVFNGWRIFLPEILSNNQ